METIRQYLRYIASALLAIITTFSSLLGLGGGGIPQEAATEDTLCLTICAVSDTHVNDEARAALLGAGLRDMSAASLDTDAVLFLGDCTDNGNTENWEMFTSAVTKNCTVKDKIVALGNHDTWLSYDTDHEYGEALDIYLTYSNAIMGTDHTKAYYTYDVCGYPFIVLAPEGTSVGAEMSAAQLAWADAELQKAAAANPGKPIFVLMHQPLNYTHAVGNNENGNGFEDNDTSKQLRAILDKYENVFYISGHQHYGLSDGTDAFTNPEGFKSIEKIGNHITGVNLPCYTYGSYVFTGDPLIGDGLVINVYADRVEFLGRNFVAGGWLDYTETVPLTGAVNE